MDVIKAILGLFAFVAIIFIGLGLIAPKDYSLTRSTVIQVPQDVVFPHVKYFAKRDVWSPWNKKDPNMISSIEGKDGTVGAISKWTGNDEVGIGQQKITEIKENKFIKTHLIFESPHTSEADSFMELRESGIGSTNITWGLSGRHGFIESVFMLFMDMEGMVEDEYKTGLADLKTIVEQEYMATRAAEYRQEETAEADVN